MAKKTIESRNFRLILAEGTLFYVAMAFASATAVVPVFIRSLGASNLLVGLTPALAVTGWLVPQIVAANVAERLTQKKRFVVFWFGLSRLPWLLFGLMALFLAPASPGLTLALFLVLHFLGQVCNGIGVPAWQSLIAAEIPVTARGRLFAQRVFLGSSLGILAGFATQLLLDRYGFPHGYGYVFLCSAVFLGLNLLSLLKIRETAVSAPVPERSLGRYLKELPAILAADRNFAMYIVAQIVFSLATAGPAFFAVSSLERFGLSDSVTGLFTICFTVGQLIGTFVFGRLADRRGNKVNLVAGGFALILSIAAAWLGRNVLYAYLAFGLHGVFSAAWLISNLQITMEFGDAERCPTYVGLLNTAVAPATLLAPVVGGAIADQGGFGVTYAASLALAGIGLMALWGGVRDPRQRHQTALSSTVVEAG